MKKEKLIINIQKHVLPVLLAVLFVFAMWPAFSVPASAATDSAFSVLLYQELRKPSELCVYSGTFSVGNEHYTGAFVIPDDYEGIEAGFYFGGTDNNLLIYSFDTGLVSAEYRCFAVYSYGLIVGQPIGFLGEIINFGFERVFKEDLNLDSVDTYRFGSFRYRGMDSSASSFIRMAVPMYGALSCYTGYDSSSPFMVYYTEWRSQDYRYIYSVDGICPHDYSTYLFLVENLEPLPSFSDRVTSGLTAVVGWVGAVVSAIVGGELSGLLPLVAVGIAISGLLLVWVIIRRTIWGA